MSLFPTYPNYVLAHRRDDGLIDYLVMKPRWPQHEVAYRPGCAAGDERQMLGRAAPHLDEEAGEPKIRWVSADELAKIRGQ